ncbi:MAG TPA: hypothetical protein DEP84_00715, partial [Chloroflexi bacterium]|nr:hypothetical protein [Chloroflexota bacterium]
DQEFFATHDETWTDTGRIRRLLESEGVEIVDEGVLDVPPWPDTVMPAAEVLGRLGLRRTALAERFNDAQSWDWSTMDYYTGRRPELKQQMDRYAFLERAPLPWRLKVVWAHHRYILMRR